ncbi:MAG: hypothetical protein GF419_02675 [Ignavibacteriales bacterium]|nr:hypothetical protein [Ignavibacteriales bacterium]
MSAITRAALLFAVVAWTSATANPRVLDYVTFESDTVAPRSETIRGRVVEGYRVDTVVNYYENGSVASIIPYYKNMRDGDAVFYYPNGSPKEEVVYEAGRIEGLVKRYHENGEPKEMFTIVEGKRDGVADYYSKEGEYLYSVEFVFGKRVEEAEEDPLPTPTEREEEFVELKEKASEEQQPAPDKGETTEKRRDRPDLPEVLAEKEVDVDEDPAYYYTVDVPAKPVGGMATLYKNLVYPEMAREKEIEGTVVVRAFIDRRGNATQTEIVEGIGYGCDDVAEIVVFYASFEPGTIDGRPVNSVSDISIEFKLPETE